MQQVGDALDGQPQEVLVLHHGGEVLAGELLGKLVHGAVGVRVRQRHGRQAVGLVHTVLRPVSISVSY